MKNLPNLGANLNFINTILNFAGHWIKYSLHKLHKHLKHFMFILALLSNIVSVEKGLRVTNQSFKINHL